jgi:hypothetical protein
VAVNVPISADPTQVVRAFEEIRRVIREAGQEGRALADIDFSHPELKDLEADLRRVDANFRDLRKVGRGETARAARNEVFTDALDLASPAVDKIFPSKTDAARFVSQSGSYVLNGTRFAPPPPAPPAPPAPPKPPNDDSEDGDDDYKGKPKPQGGGEGGGAGAILDLVGGPLKAALGFALGAAGISGAMKGIGDAYGGAEQEDVRNDSLMRRMQDASTGFADLRDKVRGLADTIHVQDNEAQALTESWVRLTGATDSAIAVRDATFAGSVARGMGLQPGALNQTIGTASYLGEDPRQFAMLIGETMREGRQTGQPEQVMAALLHWTEASTRALVTHSDVSGFAAMYSGLNATGLPGLRGQNAENLIGQMNSAVSQGGNAGVAGQILTYNAFRQNGVSDPYQIEYDLSGGMFEKLGKGTVFDGVRGQINQMYAGQSNYRRWDAEAHYFGISPRQAAALDSYKPGDVSKASDYLAANNIDLSKLNGESLASINSVMGANGGALDDWRKKVLARTDITQQEKDGLTAAKSPDEVRKMLVTTLGAHGVDETDGQKVIRASADMSNAFERAISGFVGPISDLKDSFARMLGPVGRIADDLDREYGKSGAGEAMADFSAAANGDKDARARTADRVANHVADALVPWKRIGLNLSTGKAEQRNNPLNLMGDGRYQPDLMGIAGNGVGIFPSLADGVAADGNQLLINQERKGQRTVSDLVRGWDTSPGDAPKLPGYIAHVAQRLGVDPNKPFNLRDGNNLERYINAAAPEEDRAINDTVSAHAGAQKALGYAPTAAQHHVTVTASPIVVHVMDGKGKVIETKHVPVTTVSAPTAAGVKSPAAPMLADGF